MATTKRAWLLKDTYMIRGALKDKGWQWDAERQGWYKDADWDDAAEVERTVRGYAGVRNRCRFVVELEG